VLPVTPLDALSQIHGAAVTSAGDIVVQVDLQAGATSATVTFNNATEASSQVSTTYSTCAMGRISPTNHLVWGTDVASSFMSGSTYNTAITFSQVAVLANDDLVVSGLDTITGASGATTSANVLSRVDGAAPYLRKWAISYTERPLTIFPRPSRGDYITIGAGPNDFFFNNSNVIRAFESTLTATTVTQNIYNTMALGLDKTTVWMVGGCYGQSSINAPTKLNPWSATTTDLTGGRSFIIGAKDDGTSIGPWLTTNAGTRPAGLWRIVVDANGDLIVLANEGGRGYTGAVSLNGKEILAAADSASVFKVAASNGNVVWKASLPSSGFVPVTVAPDGAVIIISPNTSTYSLTMYKNADGSVPVAFTGSGAAQAVAASATSLYVLGSVSGSADFNPGTKSDIQGTLPGIFVTRFSY
jgi:hypothetical protein